MNPPTPIGYKARALRKRIWQDLTGCTCTKVILVAGRSVTLSRDEMCARNAVRCNGRLKVIHEGLKKNNLPLGPVPKCPDCGLFFTPEDLKRHAPLCAAAALLAKRVRFGAQP